MNFGEISVWTYVIVFVLSIAVAIIITYMVTKRLYQDPHLDGSGRDKESAVVKNSQLMFVSLFIVLVIALSFGLLLSFKSVF